jgi:hypothetical protein
MNAGQQRAALEVKTATANGQGHSELCRATVG